MILLFPFPQFPNVKALRNLIITFYPDLESPESEKLTDSVSEKEEKDVDELDEDEKGRSFSQNQFHQTTGNNDMYALPIRRRQKMREELPPGWERHEVREDVRGGKLNLQKTLHSLGTVLMFALATGYKLQI